MRVLIVDDQFDLRGLIRAALEREGGFEIVEAVDCATALAQLAGGDFDVVILDVHLPDGSGLDVLRNVRVTSPNAHVMILSGATSEDERVAGLGAGADDYVVK